MTRTKWLSFVMVLVLMIVSVGCSSTGSDEGSGDSKDKNGKITLTLWYWNRSIDDELLKKVGEQFPNVNLKAQKIAGDFKAKLMTSLAAGTGGPDIVCLNDWVAEMFPNKDKFVNLYDYGAKELASSYLDWKWKQGETPDGKTLIALPMDTGPTALFYREDLFKQAGLPTDPTEVATQISNWDQYIEAGKKLQSAFPEGKVYMFDNIGSIFTQVRSQSEKQYFDKDDNFIGDQEHIKKAWDYAVAANKENLIAKIDGWSPEWNAAMNNGKIASFVGAVWMKNVLEDAAPDTKGKWRIARAPGGDGNNGGSFISVTKQSKHPKEAYEVIKWLMSPEHQLDSLLTMDLFPSTPGVFTDSRLSQPEEFYGGQATNEIFAKSAENVKPAYFGPKFSIANSAFGTELGNIMKQKKDPDKAWDEAVKKIKKELSR